MVRHGLWAALLLAATPAAAQMRPVMPATVPAVTPLLAKVCLPVAGGAAVTAGIAAGKSLGFAVTAQQGALATLQKGKMVLNLGPGHCLLTLGGASPATFPHLDHELTGWLPRLGRYWAGPLEADAAGFNARKFRAGGHTVLAWELSDEGERQMNVSIGK